MTQVVKTPINETKTQRIPNIKSQVSKTQTDVPGWVGWAIFTGLLIVMLGVYWAYSHEMVFFNDRPDMWLTVSAMVVEGVLFLLHNKPVVYSGAALIIWYHFFAAYKFNPGQGARAFVIGVSRTVVGVGVPIAALFVFLSGTAPAKDESADAYAIRSAIHAAGKAAILAGLFFFMRSLVNGNEVRAARGEFNSFEETSKEEDKEQTNADSYQEQPSSSDNRENTSSAFQQQYFTDHDILGVPRTAGFDEVRAAYHRKMKENHPDRMSGLGEMYRRMAEEETKKINAAFDRLRRERKYVYA